MLESKLESWRRSKLESVYIQKIFMHVDGSQIKKSAFTKHGVSRKVVDNHLIHISGKFEPSSLKTF